MLAWEPGAVAVAEGVATVIIGLGLLQQLLHLAQLGVAGSVLMKEHVGAADQLWRRFADAAPPISLLVPGYNEELSIVQSVRSLLSLQYPAFEVVVINDGSKDRMLDALKEAFDLVETERFYDTPCPHRPIRAIYTSPTQARLVVVDKENGGKADALNAGLNVSRAPVVCSMDADSLL
ncbi:MAG TPA: glycosyltransferase family 2 protein, partial [Caulobacteraceae bacterium]|nr:glycosyltransferase family 2 protein [Caulobacteraceae bacterium]